ncbi:MAG TPA: poly-gamma-glutamate hydrolase family protein [Acidimicrobiia bacterium]|nr:poly-gamma-glutamate hydrolase family protein [Acidimicrobiia bacterium]
MLAELLTSPGVVEQCVLRSRFGFLALHGGLEQGTAEIAREAAEGAGASYYAVVQPAGFRWHVPSHRFAAGASTALDEFCAHVEVAVSVHGFGRAGWWTRLPLGGTNRELAAELADELRHALPGYEPITDLDQIPAELRGLHAQNPVNRCRRGGVQLELPPRVRGLGPYWARLRPGEPCPHRQQLIGALVAVAEIGVGA